MTEQSKPIAESNHFIILDHYEKIEQSGAYQTEADLERELVADLISQGYEHRPALHTQEKLLANLRDKLQALNDIHFTDSEWQRFLLEYLDKPGENHLDKTRKIHHDHTYDFVFDDGRTKTFTCLIKPCWRVIACRC